MTIVAAFSASRQGSASLHLAVELARCAHVRIIAAAVVERPWPPRNDPVENEYLQDVTARTRTSLERVVGQLTGDIEVSVVVHKATSVPAGVTELATHHRAEAVVVAHRRRGCWAGSRWAASPTGSCTPRRCRSRSRHAAIR